MIRVGLNTDRWIILLEHEADGQTLSLELDVKAARTVAAGLIQAAIAIEMRQTEIEREYDRRTS
jgi:hypothetical protein